MRCRGAQRPGEKQSGNRRSRFPLPGYQTQKTHTEDTHMHKSLTHHLICASRAPASRQSNSSSRAAPGVRAGLSFQHTISASLRARYGPSEVEIEPWFSYTRSGLSARFCSPDIILWPPADRPPIIIEIKARHTPQAHYQLLDLYAPVVKLALNKPIVHLLEICREYDAHAEWPTTLHLIDDILQAPAAPTVGVLVWNRFA
jgi:hypothetical protein